MKKTMFLIIFLISGSVYADTNLPPQTITKIATGWDKEGIFLSFSEDIKVEGCADSRVRIERDHPLKDDILSIALSAFYAGKQVQVRVSGCIGAQHRGIAISVLN
ncbi:hypothetical protein K6Q96_06845 [Grimontia kaedaensis]|uniref:Uncharacterized protein n=1 Tax=Grimontia kaedaensis TaxID=2872157 RepID=A0ABY4WXK0_9GAMM|nr:hypothetical protein [Grimontia kaedaensis]USH03704.1 hypothetical protein K6Q96_06845 [Grimontia kaedaensis]